ncbi:hypothetical protein [Paraburkholderia mimosarum]|uniref:hypothetical protein n=1 Tax=Paraburkholderia mimosarum TaxID=312026 RepID=UPI0004827EDD|nr:hypothetical protein [Paraburkholderia mimosarum]
MSRPAVSPANCPTTKNTRRSLREYLAIVRYNRWLVSGWIVLPAGVSLTLGSLVCDAPLVCVACSFSLAAIFGFVPTAVTWKGKQGTLQSHDEELELILENQRRERAGELPLPPAWEREKHDAYCERSGVKAAYCRHGLAHLVPKGYTKPLKIWSSARLRRSSLPALVETVVWSTLLIVTTGATLVIGLRVALPPVGLLLVVVIGLAVSFPVASECGARARQWARARAVRSMKLERLSRRAT